MKYALLLSAVAAVAVFSTGCAAPAARAPGQMIVQDSLLAMGGMDRWNGVHEITAVALVTTYDDRGRAEANTWRQVIRPRQSITASASLPAGAWQATVNADGTSNFDGNVAPERKAVLIRALNLLQYRLNGPMNLIGGQEKPGEPSVVHVAGQDMMRVRVIGGRQGARAYYFDPKTNLLRLVTAGGDAAGEQGTATVYTWRKLPNGLSFPSQIEIYQIGQSVLVGDQPVLQVVYQAVKL